MEKEIIIQKIKENREIIFCFTKVLFDNTSKFPWVTDNEIHSKLKLSRNWLGDALGLLGNVTPYTSGKKTVEDIQKPEDTGENYLNMFAGLETDEAIVFLDRARTYLSNIASELFVIKETGFFPNPHVFHSIEKSIDYLKEVRFIMGDRLAFIKEVYEEKRTLLVSEDFKIEQEEIVYQTQWTQVDPDKEYPHGWGFVPPLVKFPKGMDVITGISICKKLLSDDEFTCIGAIPVMLSSLNIVKE